MLSHAEIWTAIDALATETTKDGPLDTVMVAHGYVFVDGSPLDEPYLREQVRYF